MSPIKENYIAVVSMMMVKLLHRNRDDAPSLVERVVKMLLLSCPFISHVVVSTLLMRRFCWLLGSSVAP